MKLIPALAALSALLVCGTTLAAPAFAGDDTTKTDSGDGTGGGSRPSAMPVRPSAGLTLMRIAWTAHQSAASIHAAVGLS